MSAVLLLNQDYVPLNICNTPRALSLVDRGKAEVLEYGDTPIRTTSREIVRPAVIRLVYRVKVPPLRPTLSREAVFRRDRHTCQYCGERATPLTLDHVMPRHRGGPTSWTNVVTACWSCNHRKGGRTPDEAGMPLRRKPIEPRPLVAPRVARHAGNPRFGEWLRLVSGGAQPA